MKHRTLKYIAAMTLALAALGVPALSASGAELASGTCGENLTWRIENGDWGEILYIEGTGDMYDYGDGFASYEDFTAHNQIPWAAYKDSLREVVFSEGVTSVGSFAFFDYRYVGTVELADSITEIGDYAFVNCGSMYATDTYFEPLPAKLKTIGEGAFLSTYRWNDDIDVYIPETVTEIGALAFSDFMTRYQPIESVAPPYAYGASLTGIVIPANVQIIGDMAVAATIKPEYYTESGALTVMDAIFSGNAAECFTITETVTIFSDENSAAQQFAAENGLNFYNRTTDEVSGICGDCTWTLVDGTLTVSGDGAMPDISEDEMWLIIEDAEWPVYFKPPHFTMFRDMIEHVIIEDGVTHVGDASFVTCENLKTVTFGDSVESIGAAAFAFCEDLGDVTLPEHVQRIGDGAFIQCPGDVYAENPVMSIGEAALGYFYITGEDGIDWSEKIASDMLTIYGYTGSTAQSYAEEHSIAFEALNGTIGDCEWEIKNGTLTISGEGAMADLTAAEISIGVEKWPHYYPYRELVERIVIEDGVTEIGDYTFSDFDHVETVQIPDSVTRIGEGAFSYTPLTEVAIPESVKIIETMAFMACSALKEVTVLNADPVIEEYALGYKYNQPDVIYEDFTIYGYAGSASEAYAEENSLHFAALEDPVTETQPEETDESEQTTVTTTSSATAARNTGASQTASPKTGDTGIPAVMLAGLTALLGTVLCRRKS